jgi:hypothetical protein
MNGSLVVEQSTKLLSQIVDDLERLQKEFLLLNLEAVIEKNPGMESTILIALDAIKSQTKGSFIFLESLRKSLDE